MTNSTMTQSIKMLGHHPAAQSFVASDIIRIELRWKLMIDRHHRKIPG